jgi:hypothetical protein
MSRRLRHRHRHSFQATPPTHTTKAQQGAFRSQDRPLQRRRTQGEDRALPDEAELRQEVKKIDHGNDLFPAPHDRSANAVPVRTCFSDASVAPIRTDLFSMSAGRRWRTAGPGCRAASRGMARRRPSWLFAGHEREAECSSYEHCHCHCGDLITTTTTSCCCCCNAQCRGSGIKTTATFDDGKWWWETPVAAPAAERHTSRCPTMDGRGPGASATDHGARRGRRMATAVATCAGRALKLLLLVGPPPPENREQNGWGDTSPAAERARSCLWSWPRGGRAGGPGNTRRSRRAAPYRKMTRAVQYIFSSIKSWRCYWSRSVVV